MPREPASAGAYPGHMARITGSWLSGPSAALPDDSRAATANRYRGEGLGLPERGPGSLAGTGRRVAALFIDWLIALGITALIFADSRYSGATSTITLFVWVLIGIVAVSLFSFTPGQFFVGIQVARVDQPARVGFVRALVRSLILMWVVPALFTDTDGRGMHDRATGTGLVRNR